MATDGEKYVALAMLYVERFGLSIVPMGDDKKPLIQWKELQSRRPTTKEILDWPKKNLAIITGSISNLVIVDCESKEDAQWFHNNRAKSPVMVQSKRGFHFYFRHPGEYVPNFQQKEHIRNFPYDIRGDGGYALAPPSKHSEGQYKWTKPLIPTKDLPVFRMEWRPQAAVLDTSKQVTDGLAYISKIVATSGAGGHDATFRAVNKLKLAGMGEAEALMALQRWNETNAQPPWSDRELLHKIRSVYQ